MIMQILVRIYHNTYIICHIYVYYVYRYIHRTVYLNIMYTYILLGLDSYLLHILDLLQVCLWRVRPFRCRLHAEVEALRTRHTTFLSCFTLLFVQFLFEIKRPNKHRNKVFLWKPWGKSESFSVNSSCHLHRGQLHRQTLKQETPEVELEKVQFQEFLGALGGFRTPHGKGGVLWGDTGGT